MSASSSALTSTAVFALPYYSDSRLCWSCQSVHSYLRSSSSDSEQVEPGAEQQAAATEGASEQAQHGSDAYGQAHQRAARTSLQEKS